MEVSQQAAAPAVQSQQAPVAPQIEAVKEVSPQAEAPKVEAPKESEQDLEWVRRFNALTKKEKSLLEAKRHIEEQKKLVADFDILKRLAKENPSELFEKLGTSYDDITNYFLQDANSPSDLKLKAYEARLAALEQERLSEKEQRQRAEEEGVISGFKNEIKQAVSSKEDYALTKAQGDEGIDLVYEVVAQLHEQTGKVELERACELVEKHLEEKMESVIKSTGKLKKYFITDEPKEVLTDKVQDKLSLEPKVVNTLTHQAVTSAPSNETKRYLSDDESKAAAADFLRKMLNKG